MKSLSKYAMLISTTLLCGMLIIFFCNLKSRFNAVEEGYKNKKVVNLSTSISEEDISAILLNNKYIGNEQDANFIADTLAARLHRNLEYPNLYYLQKRVYGKVPALVADSANVLTNVLENSYKAIGLDSLIQSIPLNTLLCNNNLKCGEGIITVQLYSEELQNYADAIVVLREYYIDSLNYAKDSILGYAKTDSMGTAVFSGLDKNRAYSVLPIKKGCEYGSSKGIKKGKFKKNLTFKFEQLEHRIQMINNATLKQIKNDGTITVRTPHEYKAEVVKWFVLVLLAWWGLAILMLYRKRHFDPLLIATTMFLTNLCVLMMYAVQNPLTEELRGTDMAKGVLIGIGIMVLFQSIDFVKLYQGNYKLDFDIPLDICRWLFLPFKQKLAMLVPVLTGYGKWYKKLGALCLIPISLPFAIFNIPIVSKINKPVLKFLTRLPKGFGWLMLALFITTLLWTPLGREIGGMKVNLSLLGLTFQPSEIAKYLILFFMAAFFTQNADSIIAYSQPDRTNIKSKLKTLGWLILGLVLLMGVYAKLGDMGPALVIGITFVLLYSLVKSKVNLDNLSEKNKWERIFTCDFAMLIYGVVSFAIFMIIGGIIGNALVFALLWFIVWIIFGILHHKQFFETAFLLNLLVFGFVFGGQMLKNIPIVADTDIVERFEQRTKMCINTWGDLDIEHLGMNAEPVSNTQVANGLWAIATGGPTGQGLGNGNANLIPAFHTDMILSSIGEQMGWIGLLIVVLCMALLLRRIIVVGYHAGHPFAFYFCMGVAIVTAVQFFIIALGSSGMIPLTGITVPLLSYGKVSMILNLTAIGVVFSLSQNVPPDKQTIVQEQVRRRSVYDYNFPISIVSWTYIVIAIFTLCVWQYYALWARGNTLVHPAYVHSHNGLPIIEYNPRIALLATEMWAGDIYDRNGLLLATSNPAKLPENTPDSISKAHTKRYYPFGEHLYFMLGDQNSGLFFSYDENNPMGYMAEVQHLSYLRDYDNTYYDEQNNPVKLALTSSIKVNTKYMDGSANDTTVYYKLRNYRPLVRYLKSGVNGRPLRKHNEKVCDGDFDLHLTIDASLQKDIQERLAHYVQATSLRNNNLLRISVVVLDAENGDLLTSANYPLPDLNRLRDEDRNGNRSYSDNLKNKSWNAYTDRDLGLTFQTYPGSTAKVMSAMSGLQKLGADAVDKKYFISEEDIIEKGKASEPYGHKVTMQEAIVKSSNCYFIHLINENDLYWALDSIYESAGVNIGNITPYYLDYTNKQSGTGKDFKEKIRHNQNIALVKYIRRIEENTHGNMNAGEWRWAWGQGYQGYELQASPLNMARVTSAVVNNGKMPYTQYIIPHNKETKKLVHTGAVKLLSAHEADILKGYMLAESANQASRNAVTLPNFVGGKTGTPERYRIDKEINYYSRKTQQYSKKAHIEKINDGWYMFFVEKQGATHPLAVCVRMERSTGSGAAVRLTKSVVLESLYSNGYIIKLN